MAFTSIQSVQLSGIEATPVSVEIDTSGGIYSFQIVGLADKSVEESRERVIGALKNALGVNPKTLHHKITVSLSPAEIQKEGAYFDLVIAVGYLKAVGIVKASLEGKLFLGELSLNGAVKKVRGVIPILLWAKKNTITDIFISKESEHEVSLFPNTINYFLVTNITEIIDHLENRHLLTPFKVHVKPYEIKSTNYLDDIKGQTQAKRALLIAAAGGHNSVLYGPPGTGKSMLAKAFTEMLPQITDEHFLEVATIYSAIGKIEGALSKRPPFRSPHHSSSSAAIIGGGNNLKPGDITLAHRGVLFLDEFPEFDRKVLEALREPLEDRIITISRARGSVTYPASCIMLATMNPCPCGYKGSIVKECICTAHDIARYTKKISGPIMDRIDLWIPVGHITYDTLHTKEKDTNKNLSLMQLVVTARNIQEKRQKKLNAEISSKEVLSLPITKTAKELLQLSAQKLVLSPRVYTRILKVAQTIADIEERTQIEDIHILEAIQYRPKVS